VTWNNSSKNVHLFSFGTGCQKCKLTFKFGTSILFCDVEDNFFSSCLLLLFYVSDFFYKSIDS
jgi:hypothetical protein